MFVCKLEQIKPFVNSLKTLLCSPKQKAQCSISPSGLSFSVQKAKSVQAHVDIEPSFFREYNLPCANDDFEIVFGVELNTLLDCLTIFFPKEGSSNEDMGNKTALKLSCPLDGSSLVLTLADQGTVTVCHLCTFELSSQNDLVECFNEPPLCGSIIIKSEWLKYTLAELDSTSDNISFHFTPNPATNQTVAPAEKIGNFRISASGLTGDAAIDYDQNSDVIENFKCSLACRFSFKLSLLLTFLKALTLSHKTSIRINERGFMSAQFMLLNESNGESTFTEFIISPNLEDESSDEEER